MNSKRELKTELIRLIACILVIVAHIRPMSNTANWELNIRSLIIECLCSPCVTLFFLISGFHIYNKSGSVLSNWNYFIKKYITKIYIPALVFTFIVMVFQDFFLHIRDIKACLINVDFKYISLEMLKMFKAFIAPSECPSAVAHLWYIFSYAHLMILYPVLRLLLTKVYKPIIYFFLVIYFLYAVLNDYYIYVGNPILINRIQILGRPIYYSIFGYVLNNDILINNFGDEHFKNEKIITPAFIIGFIAFVIICIIMAYVQGTYYIKTNFDLIYQFSGWVSPMSLIMSCTIVFMIFSININALLKDKIKNIIFFLSNKSLGVYFIHYPITAKIRVMGLDTKLLSMTSSQTFKIVLWIMIVIVIFILSIVITLFAEFVYKKIKNIIAHVKS